MNLYVKREIYDLILKIHLVSFAEINPVFDFMILQICKKNEVLKSTNEVELNSRIIVKGYIGLFQKVKNKFICRQIYVPGSIACDFNSYSNSAKTDLKIMALTECVFGALKKSDEEQILKFNPSLAILAVKINQSCNIYLDKWMSFKSIPNNRKLNELRKSYPNLINILPDQYIYEALGISKRTYYRIKSTEGKEKETLINPK
ncbi:hypothetical protein MM239_10995 [Belliella sp. DSM 111904]|uniref:cAMP-binding domain of CRP or a regulatory subunit of cAMP-dependent protein kinases n=1 Tax=Belliella filtrata TaxID=2923435 RepID=A0ABS9V0J7_9BACT|nr:hypothetical protein [Belliella filtrata]MCH7409922.1 hypothetical protein [Belliella filtrata]